MDKHHVEALRSGVEYLAAGTKAFVAVKNVSAVAPFGCSLYSGPDASNSTRLVFSSKDSDDKCRCVLV